MAHILIVEDDPSLVRVLVHFLRNAGHTPIIAPDGRSALHAVGARPHLIVIDLGLRDMRGEDLLRRFRSQPDTASIPVVVISDETDAATVAQGTMDGVAAVLRKPVPGADLCRVVEAVLSIEQACDAAPARPPEDHLRAKLVFRLILQGSTALVFQLCRLLEVERAHGRPGRGEAPTWSDIARWAKRECLVDEREAEVLLGRVAFAVAPTTVFLQSRQGGKAKHHGLAPVVHMRPAKRSTSRIRRSNPNPPLG